jgi:hypothetical protein
MPITNDPIQLAPEAIRDYAARLGKVPRLCVTRYVEVCRKAGVDPRTPTTEALRRFAEAMHEAGVVTAATIDLIAARTTRDG